MAGAVILASNETPGLYGKAPGLFDFPQCKVLIGHLSVEGVSGMHTQAMIGQGWQREMSAPSQVQTASSTERFARCCLDSSNSNLGPGSRRR